MFVCHLVVNLPCALAFSLGFPNLLRPQLTPSLPLKLSSLFYYAIGFLVKTEREHLCTVYPELPKYVHIYGNFGVYNLLYISILQDVAGDDCPL